MNKEDKQTLVFIINLNSQILKNQIDAINGNLTTDGFNKSQILVNDCVEVINKLTKPIEIAKITDLKELNIIYEYWNTKDCFTTHKSIVGNTTAIRAILGNLTIDQIKDAIDNYEFIYESSAHWYSTKLNLNKFLNYKASEFVNDSCRTTFLRGNYGNQRSQQSIISDEESIRIAREAQESINI